MEDNLEHNFERVGTLENNDWLLQHVTGWHVRVRAQLVRKLNCAQCQGEFDRIGAAPGRTLSIQAAECDEAGTLTGDVVSAAFPNAGGRKTNWDERKKELVRHVLDQLLVDRSDLPEPDEMIVPLRAPG